jgi:hypothetical protein
MAMAGDKETVHIMKIRAKMAILLAFLFLSIFSPPFFYHFNNQEILSKRA